METLKIRTGLVKLEIVDDYGKPRGVFTFSPTDTNVLSKFIALKKEIVEKEKEVNEINSSDVDDEAKIVAVNKVINYLIEQVDDIYGKGTSKVLFGDTHDSVIMFQDFFDGIAPYYEKARQGNMDKYKANIERLKNKGVA